MSKKFPNAKKLKPYPRRCAECGKQAVKAAKVDEAVKIKHDGKVHEFKAKGLPVDKCTNCSEVFFTNVSSDAKSKALREHLGLLQPEVIREQLKKYGLSQRKFATHLRVAEETVSRWLNGLSIQSRSLDVLMRLYFSSRETRSKLSHEGSVDIGDQSDTADSAATTVVGISVATTEVHPLFGKRFSSETFERRRRFQLVPSKN